MRGLRLATALLVLLAVLAAAPAARAQEERSREHQALVDLLARIDSSEAELTEAELDGVAAEALEHLSVMATSSRTHKGIPERYLGSRLVLQVGNVLLHRYQRVEDAQLIARSASSVYSTTGVAGGEAMQGALSGAGRGLERVAGESQLQVTEVPPTRFGPAHLAAFSIGGVLLLGLVVYLVRNRLEAPEGVSLVDAGVQRQAQSCLSLGIRLLQEDRLDEAMKYFQKVAELESNLRDSGQYFLALVAVESGDTREATTLVDEIDFARIEPEEAYTLGDALERRGQVVLARRVFEKIYLGDVAFRDVKERLDRLRQETASYSEEDVAGIIAVRILDPRFEQVRLVASGGMGFVFEARDSARGGERVALKVLSPFYANDEGCYTRFVHEARGLSSLDHPAIIRIHDVFEKSLPYYSMEFHASPDLKEILAREGRLSPARVRHIGRQLCGALATAHRAGVIHRDVKPSNILLGPEDRITLLDFGIARFGEGTRITLTGQVLGSPRYMAPEQFIGDEVDHRGDIYSTGLILYELLTGDLPPDRKARELPGGFPPPDPGLGIPPDLVALVMGALATDPEERPGDMEVLVHGLEAP